jgi:hypothetical protein
MDLTSTRIKEHFGIVTNDTNTTQFSFLISPPKNRESIEKQDIICLDHPLYGEACQVLAEVKEVSSYEEVAGSTIGDRAGKKLATARIIGYADLRNENKPLNRLLAPPNPGSRIYMPYASFLEDILNRGADGKVYAQKLYLGKAEVTALSQDGSDQRINFYLNAADVTSKNTLISAVDGAGKTCLATIIAEELASKTGHPMVIIDPGNEYERLKTPSNQNQAFNVQTIAINSKTPRITQEILTKKIRQNQITIITAQDLSFTEKNESYTFILNELERNTLEKPNQSFLLIIENADNLAANVIQGILSVKGRSIAIVLITSHPTLLGGKTLSQIQTQIVGKTTDPQDLALLNNIVDSSDEQLSGLRMGEWVINGLNMSRPTRIHARDLFS